LGHGELADESAVRAMGDTAVGIITSMYYDYNDDTKLNRDFVAVYNAEYKRNPDLFAVGGYDGMNLIYEALKKTGGKADGDSLVAAAKGMAWDSPRGPMSIDPATRDVVETVYIRRAEKVNGQIRNVVIAKFDNVKDPVKERMKADAK
jgi:branched-chain amino acid transport system substrate-binding protein